MEKAVVVLIFAFIPLIFGDETDKDKVFSECLTELSIDEGKCVRKHFCVNCLNIVVLINVKLLQP